jgi:hypothetical protein
MVMLKMKKRNPLKLIAILLLFVFIALFDIKVRETFRSRTGEEIYEALFGKQKTNCVSILNYQDQIIPKIDYAIWLQFETCPEELKRILSKHEFSGSKVSTDKWNGKAPYGETIKWFNPKTLGDSIMVYEYSSDDRRNIQTIWANLDSTKVFVRDIFD